MGKESNTTAVAPAADMLHIFVLPLLAPSHIISLLDMAWVFAERPGVKVSLVTTPANAHRFRRTVDKSARSGHPMDLLLVPYPSAEVGLPVGCECPSDFRKAYQAILLLKHPVQQLIDEHQPDCIVADSGYTWASDLGIPRVVFESSSTFFHCVYRRLGDAVPDDAGSQLVVVEGLPHRIEMVRSELPLALRYFESFKEAENKCFGVVTNCFYELTPEYVDHYCEVLGGGRRLWTLGPGWLCNNRNEALAEQRTESWDMMIRSGWLDKQDPGSVLYVCFGSESSVFSHDQLREIAVGLESSGRHPFVWVMRDTEDARKAEWLPQGYEERLESQGRGFIFRGWAPQLQALNHPAVGGFLTHCGWNSTIESISSGVPMVAWPLLWDQFLNERLVVEVLRVGIRLVEGVARTAGMEKKVVEGEAIGRAVSRLMGSGEEAKAMRKRVEDYKKMARAAMEEGGSSRANLDQLIEELTVVAGEKKKKINVTA